MESALYKQRKNKLVCGVCAGIADKFGWDLPLTRVLAALLMYFYGFGILISKSLPWQRPQLYFWVLTRRFLRYSCPHFWQR